MGLDYTLSLISDMLPSEAVNLMADRLELKKVDEAHLVGAAMMASVKQPSRGWQEMIEEGFHFTSTLLILFRLDPNDEGYEQGLRLMLRATQVLLERGKDAVLLFNGEHILLQRSQGRLVLNTEYSHWTQGFRMAGEIWLPHECRPLPSPLL